MRRWKPVLEEKAQYSGSCIYFLLFWSQIGLSAGLPGEVDLRANAG